MSHKASASAPPPTSYSTSPLWTDIIPIPLQDTASSSATETTIQPLATIAYSPRYSEAMSYLRAIMSLNEYSTRALSLTADIISMNPAHYTVWLYRARTLRALGSSSAESYLSQVRAELAWLDAGVCARNLKNYQVWHHRQTMVDALPAPPAGEIAFIDSILRLDTKNYHVWTYRQWLVARFADTLLDSPEEMRSVEAWIEDDIRNNSAWNHRYFLVFGAEELRVKEENARLARKESSSVATTTTASAAAVVDEDVVEREVQYAMEKIRLAPQNASPWNYLKGVLKRGGRDVETVRDFCEEFVAHRDGQGERDNDNATRNDNEDNVDDENFLGDGTRSSHAVDLLADIYERAGERERAVRCLNALSARWDPIRKGYWEWRKERRGVEVSS